jgi:hypothetical protein
LKEIAPDIIIYGFGSDRNNDQAKNIDFDQMSGILENGIDYDIELRLKNWTTK